MAGIVEQLELDTSSALRSIADIERSLASAASSFSSSISEAIEDAAGKPVVLEGDATAVGTSIEDSVSSADTAVTVEDVESGQVTSSIEDSVSSADTLVVVEGDASQLASEIESAAEGAAQGLAETIQAGLDSIDPSGIQDLGGALGEAGEESDGLANKLSGLGVLTTAATGGAENLGKAVGKLGGASAVAGVGTVVALGAGLNKMAGEAEEAFLSQQRFNATFGESARVIEQIDIGGLNTSLSELAVNLGSDDDAIRQAASDLGLLGDSAGATEGKIAETVKTVIALTAQIVAANPALGSMEEVLPRVALALSGNARAGRSLGISFTEAQVTAEALASSGGKAKDQLTLFDKVAAGANLRSKQLGDTIANDVNKALDDSTIKLRAATARLGEAREAFGETVRGPLAAVKTAFFETTTEIVKDAEFLGRGVSGALRSLVAGDIEIFLDEFGLGARDVADAVVEIGKAGPKMQPAIDSFADLESAAANTPEILTRADQELLDFVATATGKLPAVSAAFEAASSAGQSALDGLISKLPTVSSVFAEFASKTPVSIGAVTKALNQQVKDQEAFFVNIGTIISKGGVDIAQQYLDMGVEDAAALAKA
ncbi:MAG TPA: hypothetical protein VI541_02265, partial [Actinomycetota bacterium]|nr:hypothetical protein [Actinomycetota bacterium]